MSENTIGSNPVFLTKISLGYCAEEDRIFINGLTVDQCVLRCWVTQRLMNNMVPHIKEMNRGCSESEISTSSIDSSDDLSSNSSEPVVIETHHDEFLAVSVDITKRESDLMLSWKSDDHAAIFSMPMGQVGNWLEGVQTCYRRAQWPMTAWSSFTSDKVLGRTSVTVH